jgi:hypothetical protein
MNWPDYQSNGNLAIFLQEKGETDEIQILANDRTFSDSLTYGRFSAGWLRQWW